MTPNVLFVMFVSLFGKQAQVGQLLLEVKECINLSNQMLTQYSATTELSMTLKTRMEIQQVASEGQELMSLHLKFYKQLNDYYEPMQDLLDQTLRVIKRTRQQPELEKNEVEQRAQQFMDNEDLQKILRLDLTKLIAEWKEMNLAKRMQSCIDRFSDLTSRVPDETISEADVLSTLYMKQEVVGKLIEQGVIVNEIITELLTTLFDTPKTLETLVQLQPVALRFLNIWKEYEGYISKIHAAFQTLKISVGRLVGTDVIELIKSGRLLNDDSIRTANEIDVDALQTEWNQLDLIRRARTLLGEMRALDNSKDRAYQRVYELCLYKNKPGKPDGKKWCIRGLNNMTLNVK